MTWRAMTFIEDYGLGSDSEDSTKGERKKWDFASFKEARKELDALQAKGLRILKRDFKQSPDNKMVRRALKKKAGEL